MGNNQLIRVTADVDDLAFLVSEVAFFRQNRVAQGDYFFGLDDVGIGADMVGSDEVSYEIFSGDASGDLNSFFQHIGRQILKHIQSTIGKIPGVVCKIEDVCCPGIDASLSNTDHGFGNVYSQ